MAPRNTPRARTFGLVATATLAVSMLGAAPASAAHSAHSAHSTSARGASASVANQTLTIVGTDHADNVTLASDTNTLQVKIGPDFERRFDRATFNAISVFLGRGNDDFSVVSPSFTDEALTVYGGSGNDTIGGSDGNDLIFGGRGNDSVDGGVGRDIAFLGSGHDSFTWDPGEGSDVVDGGWGTDALVFNGAVANENMSLSANGPAAVFLRDIGNIRMDLDGVEAVAVRTVGGNDHVTINDMRGTDVQAATVDLSTVQGAHPANVVTVNGTDDADHVRVSTKAGGVNVTGLHASTRITGSDTTDQLQVSTQGGNDKVAVERGVTARIGVAVDLGTGQH